MQVQASQPFFPGFPNYPRDVINLILTYVDKQQLVRIRLVAQEWRKIPISFNDVKSSEHNSRSFDEMVILEYKQEILLTDALIKTLAKQYFAATDFSLRNGFGKDGGHITDASLKALAENCPVLKKTGATAYGLGFPHLTYNGIHQLFTRCPQLISINFMGVNHIAGWTELISLLPRLENIAISSPYLDNNFFNYVAENFPDLEAIGFQQTPFKHLNVVTIDDEMIEKLTVKHPKLQFFRVDNCSNITSNAIYILITNCPKLKMISLSDAPKELVQKYNGKTIGNIGFSVTPDYFI